jgi:hypothetical protein
MPESLQYFDGRKFMWDGQEYDSEDEAKNVAKDYDSEGFETRLVSDEGKHLVYTRREVEEVVVEGAPPA